MDVGPGRVNCVNNKCNNATFSSSQSPTSLFVRMKSPVSCISDLVVNDQRQIATVALNVPLPDTSPLQCSGAKDRGLIAKPNR